MSEAKANVAVAAGTINASLPVNGLIRDAALSEAMLNGCDGCLTCPFTIGEEAEQAQNYGCLPTNAEILQLALTSGKPWECHGEEGRICRGYASVAKTVGLPLKGPMNTLKEWALG